MGVSECCEKSFVSIEDKNALGNFIEIESVPGVGAAYKCSVCNAVWQKLQSSSEVAAYWSEVVGLKS